MSTDLRRKAVRILDSSPMPEIGDGLFDLATSQRAWEYLLAFARAYLAEHPADDDEPVTEDWLLAVGLRIRLGYGVQLTSLLSLWNSRQGWGAYFHNGTGEREPIRFVLLPTRGHVRRLARALGIELREQP